MKRRSCGRLRRWGTAVVLAAVLLLAAHWGIAPSGGDESRSAVSRASSLSCAFPVTATEPMRKPLDAAAEMRGFGCSTFTADRGDGMWISEC